jgi:hypothetical protein
VERKKKVNLRPILFDRIPPRGLLTMAEAMYMAPGNKKEISNKVESAESMSVLSYIVRQIQTISKKKKENWSLCVYGHNCELVSGQPAFLEWHIV